MLIPQRLDRHYPSPAAPSFVVRPLTSTSTLAALEYHIPLDDAIRLTDKRFFDKNQSEAICEQLGVFHKTSIEDVVTFFKLHEEQIAREVHDIAATPRGPERVRKGEEFAQGMKALMYNAKLDHTEPNGGSWRFPGLHTD